VPVVLAVIVLVVLAGVVLVGASRRRDSGAAGLSREVRRSDRSNPALANGADEALSGREFEAAEAAARPAGDVAIVESAPPAPFVAPDPVALGVTRRQFFNRGIVGMMGFGLSGFGGACLAFLWPQGVSWLRFQDQGREPHRGPRRHREQQRLSSTSPKVACGSPPTPTVPSKRPGPRTRPSSLAGMTAGAEQGFDAGIVALYQKCPHLGCRVPNCVSSQWFECPCHGSQFNQVGEKRGGPAPRGMDRFAVAVDGGVLVVDTGTSRPGPAIGTNTTGQEAEGPHCIGEAGGH
jgi:cytochrome b6-f complex iron-sulfur subunit